MKDEVQYRQHQLAWRRLPEADDDWVCGICDNHEDASAAEVHGGSDPVWDDRDATGQASA